jgi:tetratricopeptide (TPR) repeat protein
MRAWFAGDFERCLQICDGVRRQDVETVSQVALLRGRALLRLGRPAEAERAIREVFVAHGTLDASLTAQMLLGAARIRQDDVSGGLALLDRAQFAASTAHPTIRSEIALNRALAHYARRDLDAATAALDRVDPNADIVSARALEYRGWVAIARGRYADATEHFRAALVRLDGCRRQDVYLSANILQALSHFAIECLREDDWSLIERRASLIDWSISGLALPHYWLLMASALMCEADGRPLEAYQAARRAEEAAPSDAFRVHARCRRAALARAAGESIAQYEFATSAREIFQQLDPYALTGDERTIPLVLAEELAHAGEVETARGLLQLYRRHGGTDRTMAAGDDPRRRGYERFVEAVVADAAGDLAAAHHAYRDAFQTFRPLGYVRRAATAAMRLGEITGFDYLFEYATRVTAHLNSRSWFRREMRQRKPLYAEPMVQQLTHTELQNQSPNAISKRVLEVREIFARRDDGVVIQHGTTTET